MLKIILNFKSLKIKKGKKEEGLKKKRINFGWKSLIFYLIILLNFFEFKKGAVFRAKLSSYVRRVYICVCVF